MTNHKQERAQTIWNTYVNGYSELLCTPVEQFDDSLDEGIKKILSSVLKQVINELQKGTTIGAVIMCEDMLELCDDIEKLSGRFERKAFDREDFDYQTYIEDYK